MWCAVFNFGVLGPYFFEEDGVTVTVNSDRYCAVLQKFFQTRLGEIFNDKQGADNVWVHQDGATAHTSRRSLSLLSQYISSFPFTSQRNFLDMLTPCVVISGGRCVRQDLTPCDFFLWGYLKAKVYELPLTLEALKEAIRQEVAAITPEMILKVMDNYRERLHQCINIQGRHLSDVLFKTR